MDVSREGGWGSERNVHGTFLVTKLICESSISELDVTILYFSINISTVLTSMQPDKHMLHIHLPCLVPWS